MAGYNTSMPRRFQFSLKAVLAAIVCAAFFFARMAMQRAIDLREQRLLQQQNSVPTTHERILDLRIEDAVRRMEKRPEGD